MIVDFTISNFRSIKKKQTFSLFAENPGTYLLSNICHPTDSKVGVLKSAGIYGSNASGKSNLLLAFAALKYIITGSSRLQEDEEIPCYEPFLLSNKTLNKEIKFDIEFITPDNLRYKYSVSFKSNKILEEQLEFYPSAKPAIIFSRGKNDNWKTIKFGSLYKGGTKRHAYFENNAYISIAGSKPDSPELIRNVYKYFAKEIFYLSTDEHVRVPNLDKKPELLNKISKFLCFVDTGISGVKIEKDEMAKEISFPKNMPEKIKKKYLEDTKNRYFFSHKTDWGGEEFFEFDEESSGTQKLFELAPVIIDALSNGGVMILDELDNSMHPFMAELIIKLFNDSNVNKSGAQLIFTTHNISLMSPEYFRRDQIWFTEKNNGESVFYSLEDFDKNKVKPQSPFNKWYLEGRFGSIPKIQYQNIVELFNDVKN